MAAKCVIAVAILIVVINSIESKSVSIPEEDETVNINIKNGAGLKISYPAGEIIVPSERKNVRIKTIDVFEEKNSPPVGPEPKETDRSVLKYPYYHQQSNNLKERVRPEVYPWQQHVRPKETHGKRQMNDYYDDFETYDYYDDFFRQTEHANDQSRELVHNRHMAAILDFMQEAVWAGRAFLQGDINNVKNMAFYLMQKYLFGGGYGDF